MKSSDLAAFGFSGRWVALAEEYPNLTPARVLSQEKDLYTVRDADGERLAAVSGKFRFEAKTVSDFPAVGDFVMLSAGEGQQAVIRAVLPRKSVFLRAAAGEGGGEQVVAANVDMLFICMSLNNDFNLRRLERYLALCWDGGATPVVVLTKADLCPDAQAKQAEAQGVAVGADVLLCSSVAEDGLTGVLPYLLPGRTVAFVGSSGVGKSTLINRLLGAELLAVNGLRNDDKGRHTTTRRQLLPLPCGALVVDTPGMRELGLWDAAAGLERGFADIEELASRCRFSDCTHSGERGCAVAAAIESGELDEGRWQSYLKLKTENAYALDSAAYLAAKREKFKEIARINKSSKSRK